MNQVKDNNTVKVHYTGKLKDGRVFDTSEGKDPLKFTLGKGQMIPGFEKGLIDMKVNEKKTIHITKDEAFGDQREELIQEVPRTQLPENMEVKEGMGLVSSTPDGKKHNLTVKEVKDNTIIVDANHPLAGKDLVFDLELVDIES